MKTITTNRKYLKYLVWIGLFLIVMGLVAGLVSGTWLPVPLALIITGIVIIGLWLFMGTSTQSFWKRRSTQASTNALVASLAALGILALINFLGVRHPVRVDLTEDKLHTLSPQSERIVHSLQQPVKVWVFDRIQNPANRELLENYHRYSSQFNFEVVDPQLQPGLAQKFGVQSSGEIYLQSGTKRQLIAKLPSGDRISEQKLTNSIEQITSDRHDKIYFLQGHGEHPLESVEGGLYQAVEALKQKNYSIQPLNLAEKSAVPKDADLVVIAGPKRALFSGEVKALGDYLQRGGSLLLMVDPNVNSGLESLLQDWGIKLDNRLVIDPSGRLVGLNAVTPLVTHYGKHPITKDFGDGISFYRLARDIETKPVKGVQQTPLLITNDRTWAASKPESQQLQFNPGSDRKGPLTLGVALEGKVQPKAQPTSPSNKPTPSSKASPKSANSPASSNARLVVLGNSDFVTNGLFDQQLNGDVFLNSVSWLSKRNEQTLSIRPKEEKNRRLNITSQQAQEITLTSMLILPLIGVTAAGFQWWRRR